MILCREQLVFFEQLSQQQRERPGGLLGVVLTEHNKDEIRSQIQTLNKWLDVVVKVDNIRPWREWSRTWWIPIEYDNGYTYGTEIQLSYIGRNPEILCIGITSKSVEGDVI